MLFVWKGNKMRKGEKKVDVVFARRGSGEDAAKENPQSAFTYLIIERKCDRNMMKMGIYTGRYEAVSHCKSAETIELLAAL